MMKFKDEKVGDMVVMAVGSLQQLRELFDGCWDACNSQRMKVDGLGMTVMVGGMLAAAEEMKCLKNISFAHPHWRTPSNRLGLWCSQVDSPKSPLSKSFCGACGPP
ncbi:hypothetical protein L3X38_032502 [Prunus dulcis]|uniref:Uncharacterized protein n=1 Tax=Prunus dulcis TaxID=3755 RepID=A0AAD4VE78_PRUDU|nr:hypothetical protein L3X38_032502 [Prunus dulcis]